LGYGDLGFCHDDSLLVFKNPAIRRG